MVYDSKTHEEYTRLYDMLPILNSQQKDIEMLTKALEEILGFHDHVPADYKNGNTGPEGYPDEGEVLAHEFLVKWTESTRKALKEINEN